MVGDLHHFPVVFHHQNGIAPVTQTNDRFTEPVNVVTVQCHTGLVQDIEKIGEGGSVIFCDLAALGFSAGECSHRAVQGKIIQTNLDQCPDTAAKGIFDV